jgi:hypothetical protein
MLGSTRRPVRKLKRTTLLAILVSIAAAAVIPLVANNGADDVPKGSTVGAVTPSNSENTAPGTNGSTSGDLSTEQTALTAPDSSTPLGTGFTVTQDTFPPQDLSNLLAVNTSDFDTPNIPSGFDAPPGPQDGDFSPQTSFADSLLSPPTSTFSSGGPSGGTSGGSNGGGPTDPPGTTSNPSSNPSSEQTVSFDEQLTTPPCVETDPEKCNKTEGTVPGGNGEQSSLSVTAVHEPSSLLLIALGFAGLGALIRRRLCY